MARTMIDIDEQLLVAAAKVLGTNTKKDTVNTALREAVARLQRYAALRELQEMAARSDIDLDFLRDLHDADKEAVRRAAARAAERGADPRLPAEP
jgi:Arc/MetJ family transcription regulator